MSSFEIDVVKAEKADAMRRYNRRRNFAYFLRITGALALLLCSFKWYPEITEMGSSYFSFLSQQLYVFLLINVLIWLIFRLSTTDTNNGSKSDSAFQPDLYDQYVSLSASSPPRKTTFDEDKQLVVSPTLEVPPEEDALYEKQMIVCDNTDYAPVEENPVRDLTVVDDYAVKKEETCLRRSRSERRESVAKCHRPELRRSETKTGRELVVTGGYATLARKSMNEMNNEEFRLTIEGYIATKKKALRDENIALASKEKKEHMAITYTPI